MTASPNLPASIDTGVPELDLVWSTYAERIIQSDILIPDTDEDLTWHAFLGHSIDMQGFRAAEFAGVDPLTKPAPAFRSLRDRGIGVPQLAALWETPRIRHHLVVGAAGTPLRSSLDMLRAEGGSDGESLADAFAAFPYRKAHWTVRALLQNSAALAVVGYSFREWLRHECAHLGTTEFPPPDFRSLVDGPRGSIPLEMALRRRLEQTFYMVGPALAPYMICDWQLWLWKEGRTAVFANFKLDSFHEGFVDRHGEGRVPVTEQAFADWWLDLHPTLPPRLINECIWLGVEHDLV